MALSCVEGPGARGGRWRPRDTYTCARGAASGGIIIPWVGAAMLAVVAGGRDRCENELERRRVRPCPESKSIIVDRSSFDAPPAAGITLESPYGTPLRIECALDALVA